METVLRDLIRTRQEYALGNEKRRSDSWVDYIPYLLIVGVIVSVLALLNKDTLLPKIVSFFV